MILKYIFKKMLINFKNILLFKKYKLGLLVTIWLISVNSCKYIKWVNIIGTEYVYTISRRNSHDRKAQTDTRVMWTGTYEKRNCQALWVLEG